jgi:hypothetical protein
MTGAVSQAAGLQNPYPGLRPFEEEDEALFFGREEQTLELLRRLGERRFVAVLGLSGSGKSSLVRAGLIPALRLGGLGDEGGRWRIAKMRPGGDPAHQLSEALDRALGKEEGRLERLRRSSFGLIHAARKGRSRDENLMLLVDQFEEIFRQPVEASREFVRLILTALEEGGPDYGIYVVLTMRSDYLGDCAQFRDLPEALNDSQYLVPRLTAGQRQDAITKPAERFGSGVDRLLLQQLLVEAGDDPDQLPVLQHLLMRMWDLREGKAEGEPLTLEEYNQAGGWKDAIDWHGKALMNALSWKRQTIAKRIFQRVTELGGRERDRRRLTRLSELAAVCESYGNESDIRAVVEHFSAPGSNFLTSPDWRSDADPLVDITHESLIRQWSRLKEWAVQDEQAAEWYRRVEDRVRTGGAYLKGLELATALDVRAAAEWNAAWAIRYARKESGVAFEEVNGFLDRSRKAEADELARLRRNRRIVVAVAIVFAMLAGAASYFWWSAHWKQQEARSRELAAYAVESMERDPELSVVLGISAVGTSMKWGGRRCRWL